MSYKIEQVGPVKEGVGKYGLTVYSLKLQGVDQWLELFQKPTTKAPTVGQELEGSIDGSRFVKALTGNYQGGPSNGSNPSSPSRPSDDGMAWGNALNNATALVSKYCDALSIADVPEKVLEVARKLYEGRHTQTQLPVDSQGVQGPDPVPVDQREYQG